MGLFPSYFFTLSRPAISAMERGRVRIPGTIPPSKKTNAWENVITKIRVWLINYRKRGTMAVINDFTSGFFARTNFKKAYSSQIDQAIKSSLKINLPDLAMREWQLVDIQLFTRKSVRPYGNLILIASDRKGVPVRDVEFVICWPDGLSCPSPDYTGRYQFRLDHLYDPTIEHGPYWTGFAASGIAEEIHGFGVPIGYSCEIVIMFTKI